MSNDKILPTLLLLSISTLFYGQRDKIIASKDQKRGFYFYWGWNRGWYNTSALTFSGKNYDFTLKNVQAVDRQSTFSLEEYLNTKRITIPQYNLRIGYFLKTTGRSLLVWII